MHNAVFYSLPKSAPVYLDYVEEMIKGIQENPKAKRKIQSVFTKYDMMSLERIVGTKTSKDFLAEFNKTGTFIL